MEHSSGNLTDKITPPPPGPVRDSSKMSFHQSIGNAVHRLNGGLSTHLDESVGNDEDFVLDPGQGNPRSIKSLEKGGLSASAILTSMQPLKDDKSVMDVDPIAPIPVGSMKYGDGIVVNPAAVASLSHIPEVLKSIIECGDEVASESGPTRIYEKYSDFFGKEVEVFYALSDPERRPLFRPHELAKKFGIHSSRIGMYLNRKRDAMVNELYQATGFKHKSPNRMGIKVGAYFITERACRLLQKWADNRRPRLFSNTSGSGSLSGTEQGTPSGGNSTQVAPTSASSSMLIPPPPEPKLSTDSLASDPSKTKSEGTSAAGLSGTSGASSSSRFHAPYGIYADRFPFKPPGEDMDEEQLRAWYASAMAHGYAMPFYPYAADYYYDMVDPSGASLGRPLMPFTGTLPSGTTSASTPTGSGVTSSTIGSTISSSSSATTSASTSLDSDPFSLHPWLRIPQDLTQGSSSSQSSSSSTTTSSSAASSSRTPSFPQGNALNRMWPSNIPIPPMYRSRMWGGPFPSGLWQSPAVNPSSSDSSASLYFDNYPSISSSSLSTSNSTGVLGTSDPKSSDSASSSSTTTPQGHSSDPLRISENVVDQPSPVNIPDQPSEE